MSFQTGIAVALAGLCVCAANVSAGVIITSAERSVSGEACVNAPPWTLNWCVSDSHSSSVAGTWFGSSSNGPSAAGEVGSATSIAQASQSSSIGEEQFEASMGIYTSLTASGTCSGSNNATNKYEVKFTLAAPATMNINTTAFNDGTNFIVSVAPEGGAAIYSSGLSDVRALQLDAGDWQFTISAHNELSCQSCFSSKSSNISTQVIFSFRACVGDLDGDGFVADSDFVVFVFAYNELLCPDAPALCPADFNGDGYVDDSDFTIFVVAYNELICP